ncbi:MAG TPA: nitrilase-related carbon-nitrogen hydrolase, partial [Marmoricola sp.]|nr:nitrilase-related carbon-nitrogen hydrolase [Marmoricola sp.]
MLRVGAVQAEATPGEVARNVAAAAQWIGQAAEQGIDLVVFPEAFTTGYDERTFAQLHRAGSLPSEDLGWAAPIQAAVDAAGMVAVVNSPLDHGSHRSLSSVVLRAGHAPV